MQCGVNARETGNQCVMVTVWAQRRSESNVGAFDRRDRELRHGIEGVWVLGFRPWGAQGEEQNGLFLSLKPGNVATFGATSRRSGQRRDVIERTEANVATFGAT